MHVRTSPTEARLPDSAHLTRSWQIHAIAYDFRLEDVWLLPGRGGPGDFPRLVELMTSLDPASSSVPSRLLWALRWKLGELLGWDDERDGLDGRVASLRERLPAALRDDADVPDFGALPFTPLYLTDDEFAAEIANKTMHGVLHLGRIEEPDGSIRVQMAVLVKTNGRFGDLYMAAIRPFRHVVVYPAMFREGRRRWEQFDATPVPA